MTDLTKVQRAYLRRLANPLKPTVLLGKQGLTTQILGKIGQELDAHELIKVRFLDYKDEKRPLTDTIIAETGAQLISLIGNVATLYRQQAAADRRSVTLPGDDD